LRVAAAAGRDLFRHPNSFRADPARGASAARVLDPPLRVVEATATLVVPAPDVGGNISNG